jgi:O-antigen ligase
VLLYLVAFVAVAVATRERPAFGIAALIAFVPFDFHRDVEHTTLTLSKIGLGAAIAGLSFRGASIAPLRRPAARAFLMAGGAVAVATALTIPGAAHHGPAIRETLKALAYLALFAVVVVAANAAVDSGAPEAVEDGPVRIALGGTTILVSLIALAQEFGGAPSGVRFAGVSIPRIAGPLEGPNQLAAYLGIALAVTAALRLSRRRAPLETLALAVGTLTLALTLSRAGAFAALLALTIVALCSPARAVRRRTIVTTALGGAAAGFAVIGTWGVDATRSFGGIDLLARFFTVSEAPSPGAVGDRSELWHAAFVLWRTHPVFGIGAGNFELELARAGYPLLHTHANSLFFQALAEGGVVLLAATLVLAILPIVLFARGPFREPYVVAALAASVGFAAHQVVDLLVFFPKVGELWWIVLALGASRLDSPRAAP